MSSPSNLAVIICHGSFHTPAPYQPLIEALKASGIDAYCPQLPTSDLSKLNVGDVNHPDYDLGPPPEGYPQGKEDTQVVLDVLKPLVEVQGRHVILLGHSSGGWVATQVAAKELQAKDRAARDLSGGVIGVLYVGAFVVPPFVKFYKHGFDGLGAAINTESYFFNDLDAAEAVKWAATLTASPILTTKLMNDDVYGTLSCAYLVLDGDVTLPKAYQEGMVAAQAERSEVAFEMYRCPAGHSPHLSWTEGVVGVVRDFAEKAMV